jgi:hypothetical protein
VSRRRNRRRREERRERPRLDLHPPSFTGTPPMSLADKMRSFYAMKAKDREEPKP